MPILSKGFSLPLTSSVIPWSNLILLNKSKKKKVLSSPSLNSENPRIQQKLLPSESLLNEKIGPAGIHIAVDVGAITVIIKPSERKSTE